MWAGVLAHAQADYPAAKAQYEESLSLYPPSGDMAGTAAVLYRLGNLAGELGDYAEARRFHEESLSIRRELGDVTGIAVSLNCLGNVALDQGDYETARSRYQESQALSQESGDRRGWCWSRHLLGVVAEHEGDLALARSIYEECLPVWRELRSQVQVAWALHGIGYAAYQQGDFPVARYRLAESLTLFREMDYTGGLVRTLERLGGLAVAQGELARACRLLAVTATQRAIGARTALAPPQEFLQDVAAVRSHLEPEAFAAAWAEGQGMTLEQAIEYALHEKDRTGPGPDRAAADHALALPLLTTKLAPPALSPSLLPRPRLTARLHLGASTSGRSARLALLDASPGSGKSSLVSQWYHQQPEGSVAWLSLDREDSDPARFLLYLCAAIETVTPAATPPVRSVLPTADRAALEQALTLLLNRVSRLEQPVTLVLDDYHEIEGAPVHNLVAFLVEHLPPTLFLILTTRSDPPLPLGRLRLQGQLIEIREDELRFTHEEATRFLNECMGLALTSEMVQRLADRTEGWVAGLQMAALSLQVEPEPSRFLDALAETHRYLVEYLFEEVLQRQPPDVRTFLGETALLDRLCGPLCDAVTGTPGGQAMLEGLQAANLFLVPLDREGRWYRYHHLFADVLRARLMSPDEAAVAALHGRAAAWYEEQGMIGEAIQHALSGQQFERAAHLIEQHSESLRREGEEERVAARLEQLLEAGAKQGAPATALKARVLLARLHWQAGRRESAVAVLEPALRLAGQEEHARALVAAGPALVPILRQAALQGIAPETVGPLLSAIGGEQRAVSPSARSATPLAEPLSERELEVLRLLAAGLANGQIAEQLFLAVGTVKRHVFNIYGKLGVTSRTSAVARARELGLL
jgi:ATP/maltotriose-dependent transcriptional regulator MalT